MNKTTYKRIILSTIIAVGCIPFNSFGQKAVQDTILNPLVNLERVYTPILKDASKINTTPTKHEVDKTNYPVKFENTLPILNNIPYSITDMGSGNLNSSIKYNHHRGYIVLGGGMYLNLNGTLGYRAVETNKDVLDIFASHNSTNGNIKYLDANTALNKIKAKNMENLVKAKYSHKFDALTWYVNASFLNNGYNYYGNPYYVGNTASPIIDNIDKRQAVNIITAETGIESKDNSSFEYSGSFKYNNISYKYGPDIAFDGPKANIFEANINLAKPLGTYTKVGLEGNALYQKVSTIKFSDINNSFHSLSVFRGTPYLKFSDGGNATLQIGANINYALDDKNKFIISPRINGSWLFNEKSTLYLNVDGGINDNNLISIFNENRYVNTAYRIAYSRTLFDAKLGIKSGAISGFEFDVFGGYKYTKDEHLYTSGSNISWANISTPIYANLGTGSAGAIIKTNLIPYADLSIAGTGFFYNLKDYSSRNVLSPTEKKAWGLPTFTADANLDLKFLPDFTFTFNYLLETGRQNYISNSVVTMKDISELNLKGIYNINKRIAVYGKVNNVFNQKYEKYYGYTLQGINVTGGVSITY